MACWAHVRRRFVEAVKVQPKGRRGLADEAVAMIGKLYGVERDCKDASDAERLRARQQHGVPALAALRTWLERTLPGVTPKKRARHGAVVHARLLEPPDPLHAARRSADR